MNSYLEADLARFIPETSSNLTRSEFARDRARVLHSLSLRRLAAKTQVLTAAQHDFPRSRLTHTLEVAQIAREIGYALGADPDLVETAALTHDVGHPPFGHNGETALNELAAEIGGFEGNAQTFRVLTRLETKSLDQQRSYGLNLTRATLDAASKYPWYKVPGEIKFGAYIDDQEIFEWVRKDIAETKVCFEAQVMDFADDVAYSVHDVEDAIHAGHIDLKLLLDPTEQKIIVTECIARYLPQATEAELLEALNRILQLAQWPKEFNGSRKSVTELKAITSTLIGRFAIAAEAATKAQFGERITRYQGDLIVPTEIRAEVAVLKTLAVAYVMQRAAMAKQYSDQRELLAELFTAVLAGAPATLDRIHHEAFELATGDQAKTRVVVDQIANLTDITAVQWHQRLCK
jgi:dGTPase